jgi:YggT family protein
MIPFLAELIDLGANLLIVLLLADAVLSFFMNPYAPLRQALGRILNPLLAPIRRVVPLVGMFDLSPLILMILIVIADRILLGLLSTL